MNEDKSARYHRLKRTASIVSLACDGLLLVVLVVFGWSLSLRASAESLTLPLGWAPALATLASRSLYLLFVGAIAAVIGIPLAFYSGYVLEHRYELSTQTVGHWLRQRAKGAAVGGILALALFNLLYATIDRWPHGWWLPAGAGVAIVSILIAHVFPVLLLPLFYRITPIARDELRRRLLSLASRAGVAVIDAYEWRVSDRTRTANAGLTGLGRTRRIIVSDTLLGGYSDDEIEVILAHELGHQVHHDIWKGIAFETALALAGFYLAERVLALLAPAANLRGPNDIAGLPLLLLAAGAVSLLLVPVANAWSRLHERQADRYALDLVGNAPAFISAMRRLAAQNLAEERPSRLARILFYTHPPVGERIAAARQRLESPDS